MYLTARRVGFLWFGATRLGMLGGELSGLTSALKPGESMSISTVQLRSQLGIVVIASVLSMDALTEDDDVRIGRYQTVSAEPQAVQLEKSTRPETMASPDALDPCTDALLESDIGLNKDSAPKSAAPSIVDQDVNATEGRSDAG
jgi:hypothetical protein